MHSVLDETVLKSLCISCGICAAACPYHAIVMTGDAAAPQPVIDPAKCVSCGICTQYCPSSMERLKLEAQKVAQSADWKRFGLENAATYSAYDAMDDKRMASASGGVVSALLEHMLDKDIVDVVIHAEMIEGVTGEPHYQACISRTVDEVNARRRSFYCVFPFDDVLNEIAAEQSGLRVAAVGVPCVLRGIEKLIRENTKWKHVQQLYTIALACSHNVNREFTDYLADLLDIDRNVPYFVDLRNKDNISHAGQFNNHFFSQSGTIRKINRYESPFTDLWRSFTFSMPVCNACSDFWGYSADISVKDAWGKWGSDPKGKSLIVVRNQEILNMLTAMPNLKMKPESEQAVYFSQNTTIRYKQYYARKKARCKTEKGFDTVSMVHRIHAGVRRYSQDQYTLMQKSGINQNILNYARKAEKRKKIIARITKYTSIPARVMNKIRKIAAEKQKAKRQRIHQKKILVLGGYAMGRKDGNAGDLAQICETKNRLQSCFPDHLVKILIGNQNIAYQQLGQCCMGDPPRFAFFRTREKAAYRASANDQLRGRFSKLRNIHAKLSMRWIMTWVTFNAFLVKHSLPTFLLSAQAAGLLFDIRSAEMIYFSGSGMLTGKTLSRLWDCLHVCRLADMFSVPVVMSGQTMGTWDTNYNRKIAYKSLKNVKLIMTRDPVTSIADLKEIGIAGDHVTTACDDALFCAKIDDQQLNILLQRSGLSAEEIDGGYISIHFHLWSVVSGKEKKKIFERWHLLIQHLQAEYHRPLLFIPMIIGDKAALEQYCEQYPEDIIYAFDYSYDYKECRAAIGRSMLCVTMKHHPIVFATGEHVPVIAINHKEYYEHKNTGALMIMGVDDMKLTLFSDDYFTRFCELIKRIQNNADAIEATYTKHERIARENFDAFTENVKALIGDGEKQCIAR